MKAWTHEADVISIEYTRNEVSNAIVETSHVREFLHVGHDDTKLFIIAPKGIGKTLLLRAKSQMYRRAGGYTCIPRDKLVEKFKKNKVAFSEKDLVQFQDLAMWERAWELGILTCILVNLNVSVPAPISSIIGGATGLPGIMSGLLRNRAKIVQLHDQFVEAELYPQIQRLRTGRRITQLVMFIDNIDESMERFTGYPLAEVSRRRISKGKERTLAELIWVRAQLAIMSVARDIFASTRHIKIFVTVRSEAFRNGRASTDLQMRQYATVLNYSKDDVRDIFLKNIELTEVDQLSLPTHRDPMMRFLGFNEMPHKFARDRNEQPRREFAFDFIYRHTFGRPREIVRMGQALASMSPERRSMGRVSRSVNEVSHELFSQYKKEIVPYFHDDVFELFCELVERNVVAYVKAVEIFEYIKDELGFEHVFSYLYRLGLVGIVDSSAFGGDGGGKAKQKFLPVGEYPMTQTKIPEYCSFFVLHSALDETLKSMHGARFYDTDNIIGPGYSFNLPVERKQKPLHVHFGVSRDSLLVVIPELKKGARLLVVQTPRQEYSKFEGSSVLVLQNSNNERVDLTFLADGHHQKGIEAWERGSQSIYYGEDQALVQDLMSRATSVSISDVGDFFCRCLSMLGVSGGGNLRRILVVQRQASDSSLRRVRERIPESMRSRIDVEAMFVDRVSKAIEIERDSDRVIVDVDCSEYGSLVLREGEGPVIRPSDVVIRTKNNKEHRFFRLRQNLLVEAVYRLRKIAGSKYKLSKEGRGPSVFGLFCDIQVSRLIKGGNLEVARKLLDRSEGEIRKIMREFGLATLERWSDIALSSPVSAKGGYIRSSQRQGLFPSDSDFYRHVRDSEKFLDTSAVLELQSILDVSPLRRQYYSVFVSYSYKDSGFAGAFCDSLAKRGVEFFLFEKDNPKRSFEEVMVDEIKRKERIIFLASEDSIKSAACQFEISQGKEKLREEWGSVFLPVMVDRFLLDVEEHHIKDFGKRGEYWENIEVIKRTNAADFTEFRGEPWGVEFEAAVDGVVAGLQRT